MGVSEAPVAPYKHKTMYTDLADDSRQQQRLELLLARPHWLLRLWLLCGHYMQMVIATTSTQEIELTRQASPPDHPSFCQMCSQPRCCEI